MKSKNFFSLVVVSLIVSIISKDLSFNSNDLFDTENDLKYRMEFLSNYTDMITGGKVIFNYSKSVGTYCKVKKNITNKEVPFRIPKEFVVCGGIFHFILVEIYPFKIELSEIIMRYLKHKYNNIEITANKTQLFLFAYSLMYNLKADKEKIFTYLKKIGKSDHFSQLNDKQISYLKSISKNLYSLNQYSDDEIKLGDLIGITKTKLSEDNSEIWSAVEKHFRNHPLNPYIYHWIKDLRLFKFCLGAITTRAFKVYLNQYEVLMNQSLSDTPGGRIQNQLFRQILLDSSWSCLVPFIDSCNYYAPQDDQDARHFLVLFNPGYIKMTTNHEFKVDEEYSITYKMGSTNEILTLDYGFYLKNNPLQSFAFQTSLEKNFFNSEKYELCKKINCMNSNMDDFYSNKKSNIFYAPFMMYNNKLDSKGLNILRLYVEPNIGFNSTMILKRLKHNKWISYNNELTALGLFLYPIKNLDSQIKLNFYAHLNSEQLTRNFYKQHKEEIIKNKNLVFNYKMRKRLMMLGKEYRIVILNTIEMIQNQMSTLLKDQFSKIKKEILLISLSGKF